MYIEHSMDARAKKKKPKTVGGNWRRIGPFSYRRQREFINLTMKCMILGEEKI